MRTDLDSRTNGRSSSSESSITMGAGATSRLWGAGSVGAMSSPEPSLNSSKFASTSLPKSTALFRSTTRRSSVSAGGSGCFFVRGRGFGFTLVVAATACPVEMSTDAAVVFCAARDVDGPLTDAERVKGAAVAAA